MTLWQKFIGLFKRDKWEWEAGRLLTSSKYRHLDCKHRTKILADEMIKAGENFEIWYGDKSGGRHVWIEYKGKVLDPTQWTDHKSLYKKIKLIDIDELNGIIKYYE